MKTSRFIESQIVKSLREHDGGRSAKDICRESGIISVTFYQQKRKHGGLEARDLRCLNDLKQENSRLKRLLADTISIDNDPEYRNHALALWAQKHKIKLLFIEPGKPTQNSYIERFNCTYRTQVLNAYLFESIQRKWDLTEKCQYKYNNLRPQGSLMDMAPIEFKKYRIIFSKG